MTEILKKAIGQTKFRGDSVWTQNALSHLLWKFAAYGRDFEENEHKFLTAMNLLYHLLKVYKREFEDGKRSFF